MTLTELITRAKARFRDTGGLSIIDAEWAAYINDSYAEVMAARPDWPFMESRSESVTVTSTGVADLPEDVWRLLSVYNATDEWPLIQIDGRDTHLFTYPDPSSSLGSPTNFRLRSNTIELYPRPAVTTTLHLEYFAPVAELVADADVPAFPAQYHRLLVSGALQLAYEDNGNMQQAQRHGQTKDQIIAGMSNDLLGSRAPSYPAIVDTFFG